MIASNSSRPGPHAERDPDAFDIMAMLAQVWEAVRVYKWIVVATAVLALVAAGLYVWIWPPIYKASALIMAEKEEDLARDEFYVNWNIFRKDDPRTELQLLKSGPVLNEVIERENLTFDDVYHPITSQLKHFWETSWVGTKYTELKESVFPPGENPYVTGDDQDRGKIIDDLAASVQVIPLGESNVGEVRVKGPSPRVADYANTLLDVYMEQRRQRFREEADRALSTLIEEERATRQEVHEVETQRAEFLLENDIDFALQRDLNRGEQLATLEVDAVKVRQAIASAEAALAEIDRQLQQESETEVLSTVEEINGLRQTAEAERVALELTLARALGQYREDSPEIADIMEDLDRISGVAADKAEYVEASRTTGVNNIYQNLLSRRSNLRSSLASSKAGLGVLEDRMAQIESRFQVLPKLQITLNEFDRRLGLLQERHQVVALKRAQAEVSLATVESAMPAFRVMADARYPGSKSWPSLKIVLPAALMIGVGLGVFAAVVRHHLAGRVRASELARSPEQAPVMASLRIPTRGSPVAVYPRATSDIELRGGSGEPATNGASVHPREEN